jgi:hypothetical protein
MSTVRTAVFIATVAVAAGGSVVPAQASTEDINGYFQALAKEGIAISNGDESLGIGRDLCRQLRSGRTERQVIDKTVRETGDPRWFVTDVVIDAHTYLCSDVPA